MSIRVDDILSRPLILDTSKHNGRLTAAQIQSTGCVMVIARIGISWGYKDPEFDYYRTTCKAIGMPFTGYHVIYPSQSGIYQAENVKLIIKDNPGITKVPVFNDLELAQNVTANQMSDCCQEFGEEIQRTYGGEKGIYSSYGFINAYMPRRPWFNDYYWWLAQVLNGGILHPGPYGVPIGLNNDRVAMIQNDWKGKIAGHNGDVDFSRWIWGDAELAWFTGKDQQEETKPELTLEEQVEANRKDIVKIKEILGI